MSRTRAPCPRSAPLEPVERVRLSVEHCGRRVQGGSQIRTKMLLFVQNNRRTHSICVSGQRCVVRISGLSGGRARGDLSADTVLGFDFQISDFGFRFRVSGSRFRVWSFGLRVSGFGFWVSDCGFRVSGFGFRISGIGSRVLIFGIRVSIFRFWVSGFGSKCGGSRVGVSGVGTSALSIAWPASLGSTASTPDPCQQLSDPVPTCKPQNPLFD